MKVKIEVEIDCENAAFDPDPLPEIHRLLVQLPWKVRAILARPDAVCDAPEADDKLIDLNGNTVGSFKVERDLDAD